MIPKISIIVPVYNVEPYIHRCVDSILKQTFIDFELILVDDGSPDNCGAICDDYASKDSRIVVIHKENGGVSSARNAGLDLAKGEFVTFCDSDDYLENSWLEMLYNELQKCHADVVNATFKLVDGNGLIIRKVEHEYNYYDIREFSDKTEFLIEKILGGKANLGWEVWTRLFKSSIIRANNIHFCETCENFAEDLGFVLEYMLYCENAKSINVDGYCYFQRDGSMMHNSVSTVKLNSVNEISFQFGKRYKDYFRNTQFKKYIPIIHFIIMNNQYQKIFFNGAYSDLFKEIEKIKNKKWYFKQTFLLFFRYKQLSKIWGAYYAKRIILFSNYCLHRNWSRFKYESAIAYKWFIKVE